MMTLKGWGNIVTLYPNIKGEVGEDDREGAVKGTTYISRLKTVIKRKLPS